MTKLRGWTAEESRVKKKKKQTQACFPFEEAKGKYIKKYRKLADLEVSADCLGNRTFTVALLSCSCKPHIHYSQ